MTWLPVAALIALFVAPAPPQDRDGPDAPVARVFDVRDLVVARTRDFPAPRLGRPSAASTAPDPSPTEAERTQALATELRGLPTLGWPDGTGLDTAPGRLVVRQTPAAHAVIAAWLAERRRRAACLVAVEARFIALGATAARRLPEGLHTVDARQAQRLMAAATEADDTTLLSAPRLTVFSGQRGSLTVAGQVSYLARHDLRVIHGVLVAEPVIEVCTEGVALDVRATTTEGWHALEVRVQRADLLRPIAEALTRYGPVQVPEIVEQAITAEARLPDDGWALLAGLHEVSPEGATGRAIVVLLHARAVTPDDAVPVPRGR